MPTGNQYPFTGYSYQQAQQVTLAHTAASGFDFNTESWNNVAGDILLDSVKVEDLAALEDLC